MNLVLSGNETLESKVALTLTKRDILLLNLCLEVVDWHHAKGGTIHFDIRSLREKLSGELGESK